jgi:hypothetical protein
MKEGRDKDKSEKLSERFPSEHRPRVEIKAAQSRKQESSYSREITSSVFDEMETLSPGLSSTRKHALYSKKRTREDTKIDIGALRKDLPPGKLRNTYDKISNLYDQLGTFVGNLENKFDYALEKQEKDFLLAYRVFIIVFELFFRAICSIFRKNSIFIRIKLMKLMLSSKEIPKSLT